jgi:hypothetical protein
MLTKLQKNILNKITRIGINDTYLSDIELANNLSPGTIAKWKKEVEFLNAYLNKLDKEIEWAEVQLKLQIEKGEFKPLKLYLELLNKERFLITPPVKEKEIINKSEQIIKREVNFIVNDNESMTALERMMNEEED